MPKNMQEGIRILSRTDRQAPSPSYIQQCTRISKQSFHSRKKESFLKNGGENFDLIHCLNDSLDHIKLLEKLVTKYL